MKLEQQVVNLEFAKKMKELGFKQESLYYHIRLTDTPDGRQDWLIRNTKWGDGCLEQCSAYTVADLGEMLPFDIKFKKHICYLKCEKNIPDYGGWICSYESSDIIRPTQETEIFTADTEADARAKLLIYLKENNLI